MLLYICLLVFLKIASFQCSIHHCLFFSVPLLSIFTLWFILSGGTPGLGLRAQTLDLDCLGSVQCSFPFWTFRENLCQVSCLGAGLNVSLVYLSAAYIVGELSSTSSPPQRVRHTTLKSGGLWRCIPTYEMEEIPPHIWEIDCDG